MNNYYESCLKTLNELISQNQEDQALTLVLSELAMPYVPQPYFSQFEAIRDSIVIDRNQGSAYFDDLDDISFALKGNDALQHKALISLERMNLRVAMDDLKRWFADSLIPDWIKKQLLFFMMEQELKENVFIKFKDKEIEVNSGTLRNPFNSSGFIECEKELVSLLESHNPSLLLLCKAHLEQSALDAFPFTEVSLDAKQLVDQVESYLSGA